MKFSKWEPLKPGDVVDVVASGFRCKPDELVAARQFLENWQLVPRIPKDIFGKDILCSNSDEKRWLQLKAALQAKDSKVIWSVRGGYGSIRLLPKLSKIKKPDRTKLFVGLSDITSLHLFFQQQWQWPALHGPLLDRLGAKKNPPSVVRELKGLLFGHQKEIEFRGLQPMNQAARRRFQVKSVVIGGNLIVAQSSLATPWQIPGRGNILFFEDLGERGYRVDRVLTHFDQAGIFKGAKAIIFGEFLGGQEQDGRELWRQVLARFAKEINIPVYKGLKSGHGYFQRPIPTGTQARLIGEGSTATLICHSGAR